MTSIQTEVLNDIKTILTDTSLTESFMEMVLLRLESLGYEVKTGDGWTIAFAISQGENHYKNSCNITKVPEELYQNLCDVVCGQFLRQMKSMGNLTQSEADKIVTSIRVGDTQVSYASGTVSFDTLINDLIYGKEGDLVCFRKLKW